MNEQKLHPMLTKDVLMPHFVTQFQCNGSVCPLSCCMFFNVTFDKKSYDILESKLNLSAEQKQNYQKLPPANRSHEQYAQFKVETASHACKFLDNDWCELHRDFGEVALPDVCYEYPRQYRYFGRLHTALSLSISCPLVADLALLQRDAFEFVVQPKTFRQSILGSTFCLFSEDDPLMIDIHLFCIQILRVQEIDLWKRLAFLGLFCQQLAEIFEPGTQPARQMEIQQQSQELIMSMSALLEAGEVNGIYDVVEADPDYLVACFQFFQHLHADWSSETERPLLSQALQAIVQHLTEDGDTLSFEQLWQKYRQGRRHLQNALKDHPYFFEHLILSELLYLAFPFAGKLDARLLYRHLCFVYVFVRFILAIDCLHGDKSAQELSFMVAKLMRLFQHFDVALLTQAMDLQNMGWDDLSTIYAHLKDDF